MIVEHEFDFARRHKEIREQRGLTQQQEAEILGINANVISNWEMGIAIPRTKTIPKICLALNCPPGDLLGLSPTALTGDEYNLLKGFRDLDEIGQAMLIDILVTAKKFHLRSDG